MICPLLSFGTSEHIFCCKEECAWWVAKVRKFGKEKGETIEEQCAIRLLALKREEK